MKKTFANISWPVTIIFALTLSLAIFSLTRLVWGWTNPSANPPSGSGTLSGAIMYFATSTCPTGWSEVTAARGRYIVGLPASGSVSSTVGTALTNSENRAVGQHNHSMSGAGNPMRSIPGPNLVPLGSGHSFTTMGNTDNAGSVAGTNAPYIQFLVCQKT